MTKNDRRRLSAEQRFAEPPAPPPQRRGRGGPTQPPRRPRGNFVTRGVTGGISLIWRVIWGTFWRLGLTVAAILGLAVAYAYSTLPEPSKLFDGRARGSVTMFDRDGKVFAWRGESYNTVNSDQIAPVLANAVIATEDKRFYSHIGVDPRGIGSAIKINMAEGRSPLSGNGGSTITQQVSKLLCLGETFDPIRWKSEADFEAECRKSSLWRKIKEVPYSMAMEAKYSKAEILSIYMNRSYLGAGARGFEAASQRYFGKSASKVTPAEAAMLAGLLKAPTYYAPTSNLKRSRDRASVILGLMHDQGYLNDAQYQDAMAHPAQLSRAAAQRAGGYFADWVMESGPGFLTSETTEDVAIRTTFDQKIQKAAEGAVDKVFQKVKGGANVQVAVVVMSADGAVRAMIGGRDTDQPAGSFNRATQAQRQTGSSFKPFVFAAALDQGYTPNDTVLDGPLTIPIKGSKPWSPQNYTRRYLGNITLTRALANSINTATIRLQEAAGRSNVIRVAQGFGVAQDMTRSPSLGLGVSETTLLNMTSAYAGVRNGGSAVRPYGLIELRIKGDQNPLIGQAGGIGQRVISQQAAADLMGMMREVINNGTGKRAKLPGGRDAAGKTGTTSSYRDAWFIGFTQQYVTGVWMGYDDNRPMKGVTGGALPAEIWQQVMADISEGLPMEPLDTTRADGSVAPIPPVVSAGGDDPLAAALGMAVGQAVENGGRQVPDDVATSSEAPVSDDPGAATAPPPADLSVDAGNGAALESALTEALRSENSAQGSNAPVPEAPVAADLAGTPQSAAPADLGAAPADAAPADLPADDPLAAALGQAMKNGGN